MKWLGNPVGGGAGIQREGLDGELGTIKPVVDWLNGPLAQLSQSTPDSGLDLSHV